MGRPAVVPPAGRAWGGALSKKAPGVRCGRLGDRSPTQGTSGEVGMARETLASYRGGGLDTKKPRFLAVF